MKEIVLERNAKTVRVKLYDEATGAPVMPTTLEWRMKCLATRQILSDYATATVEAVYDQLGQLSGYRSNIPIPASLNAIQNSNNRQEEKAIDIVADRGLESEWSTEVDYYVRKRRART
jgi:hypothetical protein